MRENKTFTIYILLSLILWQLCVSVSKLLTNSYIKIEENNILSIVKTTNNGAAFGMLNDNPYILGVLGVVVIILVGFYVFKCVKFEDKIKILYSSIFTAGIIGNTYERLTTGFVTDFIKINFFNFPIFNMFDVLICVSLFIYILFSIKEEIQKRKKNWKS